MANPHPSSLEINHVWIDDTRISYGALFDHTTLWRLDESMLRQLWWDGKVELFLAHPEFGKIEVFLNRDGRWLMGDWMTAFDMPDGPGLVYGLPRTVTHSPIAQCEKFAEAEI